jgi:hypothetical protein
MSQSALPVRLALRYIRLTNTQIIICLLCEINRRKNFVIRLSRDSKPVIKANILCLIGGHLLYTMTCRCLDCVLSFLLGTCYR